MSIMKNYYKLLNLLFSISDCVAFEVETYENLYYKISEEEIIELFNKYIKNSLPTFKNEKKEFTKYKKRIIKNEKNNKKQILMCLNSFNDIKNEILFKYLSFEFGANKYSQKSRNLVLGFKISNIVKNYLYSVNDVFEWKGKKPSNITFFSKGKCIFQANSHENIIFVSDKKVLQELQKLKYLCYYKTNDEFYNIEFPYDINDNNKIII